MRVYLLLSSILVLRSTTQSLNHPIMTDTTTTTRYELEYVVINRGDEEGFHAKGSITGTLAELRQQVIDRSFFSEMVSDMECGIRCTFEFPGGYEYLAECEEPDKCSGCPTDTQVETAETIAKPRFFNPDYKEDVKPKGICWNCWHTVKVWLQLKECAEAAEGNTIDFWGCKYTTIRVRGFKLAALTSSDKLNLVPPFEPRCNDVNLEQESCCMKMIYYNT